MSEEITDKSTMINTDWMGRETEIKLNIGHGKILLFNGKGPISRLIKWQTGVRGSNGYSHAAVLTPDHTIIESWQAMKSGAIKP